MRALLFSKAGLRMNLAIWLLLSGLLVACGDNTATPIPSPTSQPATTVAATTAASTTAAATTAAATTAAATTAASTTVVATTAANSTPTKLIYGTTFEPKILNGLAADAVSKFVVDMIFDGLVRANKAQELVGKLAASWDISPDGLVYTFKLRPNVNWQDGQKLTADDVKFTFDTVLNPPQGQTLLPKTDYAGIVSTEVVDPQTIRFTLKSADASFLTKFQVGILPKHLLEKGDWNSFNRQPVGTGAWKVVKWDSGQQLVLAANPDYYGGKPAIDQFIWKVVPDANALAAQLQNGDVDIAGINPQDVSRIKQNPKLAIAEALGASTYLGLQFDNPLFKDVKVRQALSLGLNKQAIIDKLLGGQATLANSLITSNNWAYNAQANTYPFDPAKAKSLLAEAGWKPGSDGILVKDGQPFKFTLLTNSEQPERKDITVLARQEWGDLGISVELQYLDLNTFIYERVLKSNFDAILIAGTVNIDPDYLRRNLSTDSIKAGFNFLHYSNPQVDQLLNDGVLKTTQAERKTVYLQAQNILANDVALIPLYYPKSLWAYRSDLKGVDPTDLNLLWNTEKWSLGK